MSTSPFVRLSIAAGSGLTLFLTLPPLLAALTFTGGGRVGVWMMPLALLLALGLAYREGRIKASMLTLSVIAGALLLAAVSHDPSFDSTAYHIPAINQFLAGWNPFFSPDTLPLPDPYGGLWVSHYAKAHEIIGATIASALGSVEAAKCVNAILACAAWLLLAGSMTLTVREITVRRAIVIATVAMVCPVVLCQLRTFYNDSMVYGELAMMLSAFMLLRFRPRLALMLLAAATILAAGSKFTHLYYCTVAWGFMAVRVWWCRGFRRGLSFGLFGVAVGVIAVGVINFNPYVTNIIDHGDIAYPLMSGQDIMSYNTPPQFLTADRFTSFAMAQLSTGAGSGDADFTVIHPWGLLHPAGVEEIAVSVTTAPRVLGFGLLFAPGVILAVALMLVCRAPGAAWWTAGAIILMTFSFQQCWWARYAPMAWGLIPLAVAASWVEPRNSPVVRPLRMGVVICGLLTPLVWIGVKLLTR